MVLGRAQFGFGIRIDARVGPGQIPDAGWAPFRRGAPGLRHEHFGALVRELVIEFAPQQDAEVLRLELKCELRGAGCFSPAIGVRRIDFLPVQRIHTPFVARRDLVRRRGLGRTVLMGRFVLRIAELQFVALHQ